MDVVIYQHSGKRARIVSEAMAKGIARCGENVEVAAPPRRDEAMRDVAVFYGLRDGLKDVLDAYVQAGRHAIYIDLGYWNRKPVDGPYHGHHKVSVDAIHPTAYFQRHPHSSDRFDSLGVPIQPWRTGGEYVLLAGMSEKACRIAYGIEPQSYERWAVEEIAKATPRPIRYRIKPSDRGARHIDGAEMLHGDLMDGFDGAWRVVTHHSNAAVWALSAGIPTVCTHDGVAQAICTTDIASISRPKRPADNVRRQFCADLAYTQWTPMEMQSGDCWAHIKAEGLLE